MQELYYEKFWKKKIWNKIIEHSGFCRVLCAKELKLLACRYPLIDLITRFVGPKSHRDGDWKRLDHETREDKATIFFFHPLLTMIVFFFFFFLLLLKVRVARQGNGRKWEERVKLIKGIRLRKKINSFEIKDLKRIICSYHHKHFFNKEENQFWQ